jgi:hypothetical protein
MFSEALRPPAFQRKQYSVDGSDVLKDDDLYVLAVDGLMEADGFAGFRDVRRCLSIRAGGSCQDFLSLMTLSLWKVRATDSHVCVRDNSMIRA